MVNALLESEFSEGAAAGALVELGTLRPDPFTREVASVLLKRFF